MERFSYFGALIRQLKLFRGIGFFVLFQPGMKEHPLLFNERYPCLLGLDMNSGRNMIVLASFLIQGIVGNGWVVVIVPGDMVGSWS